MLNEFRVMEANIFFLWFRRFNVGAIRISSSRKLFKFHDVASESSSFIRKNVFNLSKFLI